MHILYKDNLKNSGLDTAFFGAFVGISLEVFAPQKGKGKKTKVFLALLTLFPTIEPKTKRSSSSFFFIKCVFYFVILDKYIENLSQ